MTTKAQHTPGPWRIDESEHAPVAHVRVVADFPEWGTGIAMCGRNDSPIANANARLIAAAPDLLAVCKDTLMVLGERNVFPVAQSFLRAAIAKAEAANG